MVEKIRHSFYDLMISCETDGHESKPSSKGGLNTRTNDHTQAVTPEGMPEPTGHIGTQCTAGWKAPSLKKEKSIKYIYVSPVRR